jgi:hypothetical protein
MSKARTLKFTALRDIISPYAVVYEGQQDNLQDVPEEIKKQWIASDLIKKNELPKLDKHKSEG